LKKVNLESKDSFRLLVEAFREAFETYLKLVFFGFSETARFVDRLQRTQISGAQMYEIYPSLGRILKEIPTNLSI